MNNTWKCPECKIGDLLIVRACEPNMVICVCKNCNNRETYDYKRD